MRKKMGVLAVFGLTVFGGFEALGANTASLCCKSSDFTVIKVNLEQNLDFDGIRIHRTPPGAYVCEIARVDGRFEYACKDTSNVRPGVSYTYRVYFFKGVDETLIDTINTNVWGDHLRPELAIGNPPPWGNADADKIDDLTVRPSPAAGCDLCGVDGEHFDVNRNDLNDTQQFSFDDPRRATSYAPGSYELKVHVYGETVNQVQTPPNLKVKVCGNPTFQKTTGFHPGQTFPSQAGWLSEFSFENPTNPWTTWNDADLTALRVLVQTTDIDVNEVVRIHAMYVEVVQFTAAIPSCCPCFCFPSLYWQNPLEGKVAN